MVERHEPTKTKRYPEESTEDLIEKLKQCELTKDQAEDLENFIFPFSKWKGDQD